MHRFVLLLATTLAAVVAPSAATAADPAEIALTIEENRFQPEEVRVKAGAPFVLVVTNRDKTAEEFERRELRIEKVIPPGKTVRLRVHALKPGTYPVAAESPAKPRNG